MRVLLKAAAIALLATPALSETDCKVLWTRFVDSGLMGEGAVKGRSAGTQDGFCVYAGISAEIGGYQHLVADRVLVKGAALDWMMGEEALPTRLEARVEGLRFVIATGQANMDYAYEAQSRLGRINLSFLMLWDETARTAWLDRMHVDLPGNNSLFLQGEVQGVDLSSDAALQATLGGFAVTRLRMDATLHGAFETYLLMPLAAALLPGEGDAEAAVKVMKVETRVQIARLPEPAFPAGTKDALTRLLDSLPNPSGRLQLDFRADPGFGPVRFTRYALNGMPDSLEAAKPLFEGVTLDIGWTHEDAE